MNQTDGNFFAWQGNKPPYNPHITWILLYSIHCYEWSGLISIMTSIFFFYWLPYYKESLRWCNG